MPLLLKGRLAIAGYLGLDDRQTEHAIEAHGLPVFHIGRSLAARPPDLDRWVAQYATSQLPIKPEPELPVFLPMRNPRYRRRRP
jgi:hypothetical protein